MSVITVERIEAIVERLARNDVDRYGCPVCSPQPDGWANCVFHRAFARGARAVITEALASA